MAEMIGQRAVYERLEIAIDASRKRGETLGHILLDGPPGLGKTTFATCIPNELGVSLQIASGADIRVVHPETRMAIMEMKWGLVPDMGGYMLWRGMVRDDVLRELIYTNREFTGAEAQALGLATYVDDNPRERALEIARVIALKNPHAIRAAKRLQASMHERGADAILLEESIEQHAIMRSCNQVEAVMAEMERRKPNFEDV
jgi:enoyl-CoA hydratase/carnithine racemase